MYSILIVDDEKMIRTGIKAAIPWSKIGIGKVYLAAEGREALGVFEEKHPDILLTDIRMAQMTGIELIEHIRTTNSKVRILVLTGYDNFEYARQCLKLHVQDFILKPVDEANLIEALRQQVEALEGEQRQAQTISLEQRVQYMHEQTRLEESLRGAMAGQVAGETLMELLAPYRYQKGQPLQVALIIPVAEPSGQEEGDSFLRLSVKTLCIDLFDYKKQGITFEDEEGHIAIVALIHEDFDEVYDRMEQLRQLVADEYGVDTKLALGSVVPDVEHLGDSYRDARSLLEAPCPLPWSICQTGSEERRLGAFNTLFLETGRVICNNVGDVERVLQAFAAFEAAVLDSELSNAYVRRFCFELASSYYCVYIEETGSSVDNRLNTLLVSLQGSARADICRLTRAFFERFTGDGKEDTHEIVATAKQYIRDHLADDLSVSNIAAQLYINASYLSRLFKKNTGEGCNEYIVRKRVERARSLLASTNFKTGEIAGMVGYRDANYFSLAFKKITGMSPTTYRNTTRREACPAEEAGEE